MTVQRPDALRRSKWASDEHAAKAGQTLYDRDFALWATEQAQALKERRAAALDWDNLAEEVEALARSDRRAIRSHLENALLHLLKLAFWEKGRARNQNQWREHFINACAGIAKIVEDSPSLRGYPAEIFANAYTAARRRAMAITGRPDLPEASPWSVDQATDESFLPEVSSNG